MVKIVSQLIVKFSVVFVSVMLATDEAFGLIFDVSSVSLRISRFFTCNGIIYVYNRHSSIIYNKNTV